VNVGLAALDVAFAVVALWLLGELLLQHRAAPHWRGLALAGFLVLVAGVQSGAAAEIGAGVLAFGAGQGMVTRSLKRGGSTHWSLRGRDGALPGPLARMPLLDRVFPAAELPEPGEAAPAERVGAVGPIELDDGGPALAAEQVLTADDAQPEPQLPPGPQYPSGYQPQEQPQQQYGGYQVQTDYGQIYVQPYTQPLDYQQPGYQQAGYQQPGDGQQFGQGYAEPYPQQQYAQQAGQPQEYPQPDYYGRTDPGYGYDQGQPPQPQGGYYPPDQPPQPGYQQGGYTYDYLGQGPEQTPYQAPYQTPPADPQQQPPPYLPPEPWNYG
jgi:hypothetical protein